MATPPVAQLVSQVIASIYNDQPVKVTVLSENQLFVEAYGSTRTLALGQADSFESVFEHLIHWIEVCLSYSWSESPRLRTWIEKIAAYYAPVDLTL